MAGQSSTRTTNAVIIERVDNLKEDIREVKDTMNKLLNMMSTAQEANQRSKDNKVTIDGMAHDIACLRQIATSNKQIIERITKWTIAIGTPLTISFVLALIGIAWGLLNHDIAIIKNIPTAIPTILP